MVSFYDAIIVGSGFGGAMAAHVLVGAGWKVLLLERGDWVSRGPHNWDPESVGDLTPHYSTETPYLVIDEAGAKTAGAYHCVGGPSVFYGGVSLRFRAKDFEYHPEIADGSEARWPLDYGELEPHYATVERLLGVAGDGEDDPTGPPRSGPYPQRPADLAPVSRRIDRAARELGYRPFRLPLAIDYAPGACRSCGTCDGYACAVSAKNDLATAVIAPLLRKGLRLETNMVVTRLLVEGDRIAGVETVHRMSGRPEVHRGRQIILAAGALGTPHLLLASGLEQYNPGGHVVGRYLMRHYNEIMFGIFPKPPNPGGGFHKQLGIHDFYFGHPSVPGPRGKLGSLQQLATPPVALVRAHLPRLVGDICAPWVEHLTGLLVMAEDQPLYENRVTLDSTERDQYGRPRAVVHHRHTPRDRTAGAVLARQARKVLRRAGAWAHYRHRIDTFSHAVGTVRMGPDPKTSVLDSDCHFRGIENLLVVDGSVMPTSAAVNPSLTIAALSLRAAGRLVAHTASPQPRRHAAVRG